MRDFLFEDEKTENEADVVGARFANITKSNDEVLDLMSSKYGKDLKSKIAVHHDDNAADYAKSRGKDAVAHGSDIFFGKGVFEKNTPESRGLLAHEATHVMQQDSSVSTVASAPSGSEQGGLTDSIRKMMNRRTELGQEAGIAGSSEEERYAELRKLKEEAEAAKDKNETVDQL
ncbi:MAG: DUF4157 domain-containing protein [Clostridia bacterium]|nr:DUF4157 domain-containing protein [Clostridia bacterium]